MNNNFLFNIFYSYCFTFKNCLFMKNMIYCFLFYVCFCANTVNAQVNVQDSLALVDLYNSTDGPHWSNNTNWLSNSPISTWFGIGVTNERVTRIGLPQNKLNGSLPSSLANLAKLENLYLPTNQLINSIPHSLVNLRFLYAYNNKLSGSIPSSIGNLINLRSLDLYNNQLSGSIPSSIGNLK